MPRCRFRRQVCQVLAELDRRALHGVRRRAQKSVGAQWVLPAQRRHQAKEKWYKEEVGAARVARPLAALYQSVVDWDFARVLADVVRDEAVLQKGERVGAARSLETGGSVSLLSLVRRYSCPSAREQSREEARLLLGRHGCHSCCFHELEQHAKQQATLADSRPVRT